VRRILTKYGVVLVVRAAKLAAVSGPDAGNGRAAPGIAHTPAIKHVPVTAAISGGHRVPSRNKRILNRGENNVVIGFLSQVRPIFS
jgi:hypothetical protein